MQLSAALARVVAAGVYCACAAAPCAVYTSDRISVCVCVLHVRGRQALSLTRLLTPSTAPPPPRAPCAAKSNPHCVQQMP